jgi:hemimethylated DNA binding protein
MVDDSDTTTYVAERHLQIEDDLSAIQHPFLHVYFEAFKHGRYSLFTKQSQ